MMHTRLSAEQEAEIRRKRAECSEIAPARRGRSAHYRPVALTLADLDVVLAELDVVRRELAAAERSVVEYRELCEAVNLLPEEAEMLRDHARAWRLVRDVLGKPGEEPSEVASDWIIDRALAERARCRTLTEALERGWESQSHFLLCREIGVQANRKGECVEHGGDACLFQYVQVSALRRAALAASPSVGGRWVTDAEAARISSRLRMASIETHEESAQRDGHHAGAPWKGCAHADCRADRAALALLASAVPPAEPEGSQT